MKFAVVWTPSAERELASLWNAPDDRSQIAASADEIDQALIHHPLTFGESRGGITRIAIVGPLVVLFDVSDADRRVTVWDLWRSE